MRTVFLLAMVLLTVALSGCISTDEQAPSEQASFLKPERVNVVATIVPLGHFAKMVGGEGVNVEVLIEPGTNPHTFEPSPSQLRSVENADLYVKNGAGLEIWMDKIIRANGEMLVVDSSEGIDLIESSDHVQDGHDQDGHDQDDHVQDGHDRDDHDQDDHDEYLFANPHIWLSPKNAMIQVGNICNGLIQVDPSNEAIYIENRDRYLRELCLLDAELNAIFAEKERKRFLVLHPAWSYLARDYGLEQIPILLTEKEPGPRYLAGIVDVARESNITVVFVDANFNPKSAEIIASEIDGRVVALDPLKESYLENMRQMSEEIASSLEP